MLPKEAAVLAHRTWINGKPANDERVRIPNQFEIKVLSIW